MRALRDAEVYSDPSAVNLLVTHGVLGSLGVLLVLEIDEPKTTRTASLEKKDLFNKTIPTKQQNFYFLLNCPHQPWHRK